MWRCLTLFRIISGHVHIAMGGHPVNPPASNSYETLSLVTTRSTERIIRPNICEVAHADEWIESETLIHVQWRTLIVICVMRQLVVLVFRLFRLYFIWSVTWYFCDGSYKCSYLANLGFNHCPCYSILSLQSRGRRRWEYLSQLQILSSSDACQASMFIRS